MIKGLEKTLEDFETKALEHMQLKWNKRIFETAVESFANAVAILDMEGKLIYLNNSCVKMWGYNDKGEMLGRFLPEFFEEDRVFNIIEELHDKDEAEGEDVGKRKDGSLLNVRFSASIVRDEPDSPSFIFGLFFDITEHKRMEEELWKSREKYKKLYVASKKTEKIHRSLLRSTAAAIVTCDLGGRVNFVSPVFVQTFGWTLEEIEGEKILFDPKYGKESTSAIIKDLIKTGKPCHDFETKRYAKNGHLLDVSISASRYDDHEGNPIGIVAILRDISERKRLEAQLRYFDRIEAIGTLAGGIAHDFNNLMMGMLGNLSLILCDTNFKHPHYEKLQKIDKYIQSGSKLTRQLLAYARKGKYEVRPISLNQIVKDTSETFGRTKKEIRIYTEFSKDLFAVRADEVQIEQVLINLYINAAHAMPDGGNLFLETMNSTHKEMKGKPYVPIPGNYVLLKVADQGAGIDKKIIDRIFEPFFTTKQMGRGTGLGLASVYGIVKSHGGYIDVDSKKGHGTTFSVFLPASDESIQQILNISEQIVMGSETILLVDDEELVLDVSVQMLEKLGYDVLEAKSGKKAIAVYKEKKDKIDLVILDAIMPEMTGEETYYKLKEINPKVKTLLSSGYTINGKATEMMKNGCNGFIQKPFSMEALSQKIREILDI